MSGEPGRRVDARGTRCPEPMRMAAEAITGMRRDEVLAVLADDAMVFLDLPDWCARAGHEVLSMEQRRDVITTLIRVASRRSVAGRHRPGDDQANR